MNHDMSDAVQPEPLSLRQRQQQETRTTIVEAFLDLSHQTGAVNVSIPAVAAASGISARTVYRYFATKDELQTAAAYHLSAQALGGGDVGRTDQHNLLDTLKMIWSAFDEKRSWVLAEHATPAGREIRTTRLDGARATVRRALPGDVDDQSVDLVVAVTSSAMFLELVERMGYPPEVAAEMATRVATLILADVEASTRGTATQTESEL